MGQMLIMRLFLARGYVRSIVKAFHMSNKSDSSRIGNLGGQIGEDIALRYLCEQGYILQKRNFTSRYGELDLILTDPDLETIVFVEVKAYRVGSLLDPLESITRKKIQKLLKTVRYYQTCIHNQDSPMRFDVIVVQDSQIKIHLLGAITL